MLVECIRDFRDMAAGVMRHQGEQFDVDEGRYKALKATRYGQLVKAVEAAAEAEAPAVEAAAQVPAEEVPGEEAPKPKRRTTRKKADGE